MKTGSIVLSILGLLALLLAVDGGTTRIFLNPRGFEAGASVAVIFWMGLAASVLGLVCSAVHHLLKKISPWKSAAFLWCSFVFLAYALVWLFPPGDL